MIDKEEIAILDFGSQYTHLIARRVRELGVIGRIYPHDVHPALLVNSAGIILSGGPKSINNSNAPKPHPALFMISTPMLGLCYGHQLMAVEYGGVVESGSIREYGNAKIRAHNSPIFDSIPIESTVWMSHGDSVLKLPIGFSEIATSFNNSITGMANVEKSLYSLQFHPEVHHTQYGKWILSNFVFKVCDAKVNWDSNQMMERIQNKIRKEAGNKKVFLLVSGGVDSTICFSLLEKTLGRDRVYGFHIDHGFMRKNESNQVIEALESIGLPALHIYNGQHEFTEALHGVIDPEVKRKIIGDLFLDITDRIMKELGCNENEWLLGQGTIYPDTIESGDTKNSDKIKTHHNRVDRVREMIDKNLIIEPISDLYKDEVREIGRKIGLPSFLVDRHPFPGPGLAIRCLCSSGDKTNVTAMQHNNTLAFYKLPIKSVGVQGDERTYNNPALLTTKHSYSELREIAPEITNRHKDINRVLTLILGEEKKITSSCMRKAYLTKERISLLREVDAIVNTHINNGSCRHVWQMPVVLIPFGYNHGESVVIRPVESKEAMTVTFAEIPENILNDIIKDIENLLKIDYVFYDVTNKPPGTIEWE